MLDSDEVKTIRWALESSPNNENRFDLIPFAAIGEIADVLAYGAEKYEANNWCRGTNWGRYFAAMCRLSLHGGAGRILILRPATATWRMLGAACYF